MSRLVLITGGAGFIGSHVADALLAAGDRVRALDSLVPQVHGADCRRPSYLDPDVELIAGDVRDASSVRRALRDVDAVIHLAAAVGVGQSMYEIAHYTDVNNYGTGVLLEAIVERPVERLVVASSMSIYGEGLYRDAAGAVVPGTERSLAQLQDGDWEVRGEDGVVLEPLPTPEWKAPTLASVYALSKFDQERMCLMIGRAYRIPTVALRFFNVYGVRQALSNPYTGVLAIFEDGLQRRDFVSVYDVAQACRAALDRPEAVGQAINIGSGQSYSVREIAARLAAVMGRHVEPEITGKYRVGDIRHCFADVSRARTLLGFEPSVPLEMGLPELADWLEGQEAADRVAEARAELASRGLTV